jgi:hypothetical protein
MLGFFKDFNIFLVELRFFKNDVRHFRVMWNILNDFEASKWNFQRRRGFCEAYIKITRIFEEIFRKMEALIRNRRLVQRLRCFLKTFSMELRLFKVMWGYRGYQGFFKLFPEKYRLFSIMWDILKDKTFSVLCYQLLNKKKIYFEKKIAAIFPSLFSECGHYITYCRGGFLAPVHR